MNYLTIEEVYAIHQTMIAVGGGRGDIHNLTLLHSAVERPKAIFGRQELYPSIWLKAAALLHSLVKNHAFDDGNKRTAYYGTKRFLFSNGYILKASKQTVVHCIVNVDVKNLSLAEISRWFISHSKKK